MQCCTSVFTSIESFDAVSDGDFLFCSWLPDGFYFSKIKCVDSGEYVDYYWIYSGDDSKIEINIYDKKNNEINSFTGEELKNGEQIKIDNGITIQIYENNDEYVGYFEYENWWYNIQAADKDELISVIKGMKKYE